MQQKRVHKSPMSAPESRQLWVSAGVHREISCAHARMLQDQEAARVPVAPVAGAGVAPHPFSQGWGTVGPPWHSPQPGRVTPKW